MGEDCGAIPLEFCKLPCRDSNNGGMQKSNFLDRAGCAKQRQIAAVMFERKRQLSMCRRQKKYEKVEGAACVTNGDHNHWSLDNHTAAESDGDGCLAEKERWWTCVRRVEPLTRSLIRNSFLRGATEDEGRGLKFQGE